MSRRDLSALDRDIGQPWSRIIDDAFQHGITNDMIYGGLEPGQTALQAIHAISATKNCRVGTRRVTWDGKVYRYTKAGATLKTTFMCSTTNRFQELGYAAVTTGADAAGTSIIVTVGTGDGDGNGKIDLNALADGILCVDMGQVNADALYQLGIVSNTATSTGGPMTIVVDEPFPLAVTDSMYVEAMMSSYSGLTNTGLSVTHVDYVGLPQRAQTAEIPYGWILTWGPCWITPANDMPGVTYNPGAGTYHGAQLVAWPDASGGSVAIHEDITGYTAYQQHVGFVISWAQAGTQGAPFMMLQISP